MPDDVSLQGLSSVQAAKNIKKYGKNEINKQRFSFLIILLRQFSGNYFLYLLILSTFVSFLLGERLSSIYIFLMILISVLLGFWNEYLAQRTINKLIKKLDPKVYVKRDGKKVEVYASEITINDLVFFYTGSIIPADIKITFCENLAVNEAPLTGESLPIAKNVGDLLFMGSIVESGYGEGIVLNIGQNTKYGKILKSLTFVHPETSFQKNLKSFSEVIIRIIIIFAFFVFVVNTLLGKSLLVSLMFALAIAVGLTPEFLPLVVTLSLTHGAGKLARKHVVARRLIAVENLGNMDILCSDKTGTLTEGKISLSNCFDIYGNVDEKLLFKAYLSCVSLIKHFDKANFIDEAIIRAAKSKGLDVKEGIKFLDYEPFDYNKKASFSLVSINGQNNLLVKGSVEEVLSMCKSEFSSSIKVTERLGAAGYRVVALAQKILPSNIKECSWDDVDSLDLLGFLAFYDPPKADAKHALSKLEKLNVQVKILTGDNELVTLKICSDVGLKISGIVLGYQLRNKTEKELFKMVSENNVFARLYPEDKILIVKTLQKLGHTVGFLGDGINDAPSLYASDVGISVNTACDVAKNSASVILARKGLDVLYWGVEEGRKVFNNTVKYILMGASSNFGNMFSACFASLALPFLPMTPLQILLNNTLYDISQLSIPTDNVDKNSLLKPKHWDIGFIKKYIIFFGPISSLFDFITFYFLIFVFGLKASYFQTGWFLESLITQTLIIYVIRTAKTPFFRSRPSLPIFVLTFLVVVLSILVTTLPIKEIFGFTLLPKEFYIFLAFVVFGYILLVDFLKSYFIAKFKVWN